MTEVTVAGRPWGTLAISTVINPLTKVCKKLCPLAIPIIKKMIAIIKLEIEINLTKWRTSTWRVVGFVDCFPASWAIDPINVLSPVRIVIPKASPFKHNEPLKTKFFDSVGLSFVISTEHVMGTDSPVIEEASTLAWRE